MRHRRSEDARPQNSSAWFVTGKVRTGPTCPAKGIEILVGPARIKGWKDQMTGPLTYPPEILIESSVELPPELSGRHGVNEAWFELIGLATEFLAELLFSL